MCFIKYVVIEGFKNYKDRIEPAMFSPKHNVIGALSPPGPLQPPLDAQP